LSVDGENEQELVSDLKKGDNDGEGQKGNEGNHQEERAAVDAAMKSDETLWKLCNLSIGSVIAICLTGLPVVLRAFG
jgi:hypothetical protein